MATVIQLRHDTSTNWALYNPILAIGEFGYETDTNKNKMGNGVSTWNNLPYYGVGSTGATGPARPSGQALINFGVLPGSNEASVVISDATILSTSVPIAQYAAIATSDHTVSDHTYISLVSELSCGAPIAGVGFTIYATSIEKMSGTFNIVYTWS
jgi:hypothetical protein